MKFCSLVINLKMKMIRCILHWTYLIPIQRWSIILTRLSKKQTHSDHTCNLYYSLTYIHRYLFFSFSLHLCCLSLKKSIFLVLQWKKYCVIQWATMLSLSFLLQIKLMTSLQVTSRLRKKSTAIRNKLRILTNRLFGWLLDSTLGRQSVVL